MTWRALSEDTGVTSGELMFAIGAAGTHEAHMSHATEHADGHSETPVHDEHADHDGQH